MSQTPLPLMIYADMRKRQRTSPLRMTEVPVEHAVSLPLPTLRWATPAYASFASPALRLKGAPARQDPPDRWWAVDPSTGRTLSYTLWKIVPFAAGEGWAPVMLPAPPISVADLQAQISNIEVLMDAVVGPFFAGAPGDPGSRQALAQLLAAFLPPPLQPQYRALAPDFFAWLAG